MQTGSAGARVSRIAIAPVKALALQLPAQVELSAHGVAEDRRIYLIDESGRLVNDKRMLRLMLVAAHLDLAGGTLSLRFPEGGEIAGELVTGDPVSTIFFGRPVAGHLLVGPWGRALSDWIGRELRLVMADQLGAGTDRGIGAAVSIISRGSIADVARAGGAGGLDGRRFRMLFEVDGLEPYEEESWIGRDVRIGHAVVRPRGNVGRCAVTTCDPDSALRDFDTLEVLARHRRGVQADEPLPLGVVGRVVRPGTVRVGDRLELA